MKYYIDSCNDVGENAGGVYIEIYTDEERTKRCDSHAITAEDIEEAGSVENAIRWYLEGTHGLIFL